MKDCDWFPGGLREAQERAHQEGGDPGSWDVPGLLSDAYERIATLERERRDLRAACRKMADAMDELEAKTTAARLVAALQDEDGGAQT